MRSMEGGTEERGEGGEGRGGEGKPKEEYIVIYVRCTYYTLHVIWCALTGITYRQGEWPLPV